MTLTPLPYALQVSLFCDSNVMTIGLIGDDFVIKDTEGKILIEEGFPNLASCAQHLPCLKDLNKPSNIICIHYKFG